MTENTNKHKQNQSELELLDHSMAETNGHRSDGKTGDYIDAKGSKRRRLRGCCLCCAAFLVVIVVIIVVLALTVFKSKDPTITVTSVSVEGVKATVDAAALKVHLNLTVMAGLAVKNRNKLASFKHGNSATIILYRGDTVGQAVLAPGTIKADKTVYKNVTVTVYVDELLDNASDLLRDGLSGSLALTTRTEIAGRAKIAGLIKKHISVRVECNVSVDVGSRTTEMQGCDKSYKL